MPTLYDSQGSLDEPTTLIHGRPLGPCNRCRTLKVKCEFKPSVASKATCKRCFNGGHDCTSTRRFQKLQGVYTESEPEDSQSLEFGDFGSLLEASQKRPRHHIPSNTNNDPKDTQYPKSSTRYLGKIVTPDLAFNHATLKGRTIFHTLTRYGYEGSYLVQVGFNPELLCLGQGILQEIFIFLESELDPAVVKELATVLDPFPVTIYTPGKSRARYVPSPPENENVLDLWIRQGIYQKDVLSQAAAPTDGNEPQNTTTNGAFLHKSVGGGNGDRGGREEGKTPSSGSGDNSGSGGAGGNPVNSSNDNPEQTCTREISIPFSSTLTLVEHQTSPDIKFKTNACVEIKIEENYRSQSCPEGLRWGGPWFEVKMVLLDAGIQTVAREAGYHLTFSQIRFIASKSRGSFPILSFGPSRVEEDTVKSKTERNTSRGIRGVLSANPSLRLEGTYGHVSGEERIQKRWEVVGHSVPSDKNDITKASQTAVIWKYTHNTAFYSPEAQNSSVGGEACLEVEVVMCYSWFTPPQTLRDRFTGRSKLRNRPPTFLNFLHQTSVVIDLEKVNKGTEWMMDLDADEEYPVEELGKAGQLTVRQSESSGYSNCQAYLQAALHGRIDLNEQQKGYARAVLESLKRRISVDETGETSGMALLTPSPTPSPTSSIFKKHLDPSSDISSEDMDSDMDIDSDSSTMPRNRLALDQQVMSES